MLLAAGVAIWFVISGATLLPALPAGGRRSAVPIPTWVRVARRVRGIAEIGCGLAVLAGAFVGFANLRVAVPDRLLGLVLAGLAAWSAAEAVLLRRWARFGFALAGFFLAVFYAGFR